MPSNPIYPAARLRALFERSFCLRDIAESLYSLDGDWAARDGQAKLQSRYFDVAGVVVDGEVRGYVLTDELKDGTVRDHLHPFVNGDVLPDLEPIRKALEILGTKGWLMVSFLDNPSAILTRGDLQKAPFRVWLFGLINLLEMQLLHHLRTHHGHLAVEEILNPEQLAQVKEIWCRRKAKNEETDLCECLYLKDKFRLFKRFFEIPKDLFPSSRSFGSFCNRVQDLRNNLAHANPLPPGEWEVTAETVAKVEEFLAILDRNPSPLCPSKSRLFRPGTSV